MKHSQHAIHRLFAPIGNNSRILRRRTFAGLMDVHGKKCNDAEFFSLDSKYGDSGVHKNLYFWKAKLFLVISLTCFLVLVPLSQFQFTHVCRLTQWHNLNGMKKVFTQSIIHPRTVYLDTPWRELFQLHALGGFAHPFKSPQRVLLQYSTGENLFMNPSKASKDYRLQAKSHKSEHCEAQYKWQLDSRPNCNTIHEVDLSNLYHPNAVQERSRVGLIGSGYWSDIWKVLNHAQTINGTHQWSHDHFVVAKTLKYQHDVTLRNIDRNRRDFMTMERLTSSKYVTNVYGYCGVAGLMEYADGGDLSYAILSRKIKSLGVLRMATQGAMGLAALHNVDKEGQASIAHTDIGLSQFVFVDGRLKLNDFNRARFIAKYKANSTNCPYYVGANTGKWRSPEEYRYSPQTEKVDMYSFGNVLYVLLHRELPFRQETLANVKQLVLNGTRPTINLQVQNSSDPVIQILMKAMMLCYEHQADKRANARQIETMLKDTMQKYDPGRLKQWGDV